VFKNLPPHARPILAFDLPVETRATCSACVMAKPDWPLDARDPGPFRAQLKCCTFDPFLPNFSIGKILAEEGAPALEKAIAERALSPLGLIPKKESSVNFGRESASRCVFLSPDARCSIWANRPSVCRSYFCVSNLGPEGQERWRKAEQLGNEAEWTLAHEVLWDMGFTQDDTATFAEWTGRERDFFIECARRAFSLTRGGIRP
jgi:Fe-S-cluster containining protein